MKAKAFIADAKMVYSGWNDYGVYMIMIDHGTDNFTPTYAVCAAAGKALGRVKALAQSVRPRSSASHLHFELMPGTKVNPELSASP